MDVVERLPEDSELKTLTEVNANLNLNPKGGLMSQDEEEKLDTNGGIGDHGDENGIVDGEGDEESNSNVDNEEEEDGVPNAKVAKLMSDEADEQSNLSNQSGDVVETKGRKKNMHQCPECEKRFLKKGFLTKHLKTHSQPRPFACDYEDCDKTFVNQKSLDKHQKSVHQGEDFMLHLCQFCQKGFITRAEMDNHAEAHLTEYKMYACRYCGKTFNKKFAMKIAVQASHDQVIKDPCPYCNKIINANAYKDN